MDQSKYIAFISYSHRDSEWAQKLQTSLEKFVVPKALRRDFTFSKRRLGKVFLDRTDLSGGHSLTEKIQDAINNSQYLIVVCSPAAAQSKYVNKEIELFTDIHGPEKILTVIVGGEPNAESKGLPASEECFPSLLLRENEPEPLAADFRTQGDGFERGSLKIVAGLMDIALGDLSQRHAHAEKVRARTRNIISGAMASLALIASASAVWAVNSQQEASRSLRTLQQNSISNFLFDEINRSQQEALKTVEPALAQPATAITQLEYSNAILERLELSSATLGSSLNSLSAAQSVSIGNALSQQGNSVQANEYFRLGLGKLNEELSRRRGFSVAEQSLNIDLLLRLAYHFGETDEETATSLFLRASTLAEDWFESGDEHVTWTKAHLLSHTIKTGNLPLQREISKDIERSLEQKSNLLSIDDLLLASFLISTSQSETLVNSFRESIFRIGSEVLPEGHPARISILVSQLSMCNSEAEDCEYLNAQLSQNITAYQSPLDTSVTARSNNLSMMTVRDASRTLHKLITSQRTGLAGDETKDAAFRLAQKTVPFRVGFSNSALLSDIDMKMDGALSTRFGLVRERSEIDRQLYSALAKRSTQPVDGNRISELRRKSNTLTAEINAAEGRIKASDIQALSLLQPYAASLPAVSSAIPERACVYYFYVVDTDVFRWSVQREKTSLKQLDRSYADIRKAMDEYQSYISNWLDPTVSPINEPYWRRTRSVRLSVYPSKPQEHLYHPDYAPARLGRNIFNTLFGVDPSDSGCEHLVISSSGEFASFPFGTLPIDISFRENGDEVADELPEALTRPGVRGAPLFESKTSAKRIPVTAEVSEIAWLVESFSFSLLPRPSMVIGFSQMDGSVAENEYFGASVTDYEDPRLAKLFGAIEEVRSGARLFEDATFNLDLSEQELESEDLGNFRILHFATHGFAQSPGGIGESALAWKEAIFSEIDTEIANEGRFDGFLTASEIGNLSLDADLVILSSCDSAALGDERNFGRTTTLTDAFFYSGARSVLGAHQELMDESAFVLVSSMLRQMSENRDMTPSRAVQIAMQELIDGGRFQHPSHWGVVSIYGLH